MYFLAIAAVGLALLVFFGRKKSHQVEAAKHSDLEKDRLNTPNPEFKVSAKCTEPPEKIVSEKNLSPQTEAAEVPHQRQAAENHKKNEATKLREKGDRRGAYKSSMFLPPIRKGYQIFLQNMGVKGLGHRREAAIAFIDDLNQTLHLEHELDNPQDANAIKVIGLGDSGEYFLGYLPKDAALQIVKTKCLEAVYGRLVRAYRGTNDYLEIQLQIVGLKAKKSEFDAFAKKLPAQDSHKEYLKYWSIPFDDDLTVGDAEQEISEHSSKARLDARAWEEYTIYQNLLDVFDDESQREYYEIQKVPRAVVMATVNAMRDELGSYSEVAEDPDAIAQRVLEDHPELTLEK
ncbi:MAG TPA: hypothetical protein PKX95_05525 [Limnohabitans sp.]|nr:hypothetical protein [Limnohabitans sp.]HQS26680.1 hypothetical protein [Limnohabitans sp.]